MVRLMEERKIRNASGIIRTRPHAINALSIEIHYRDREFGRNPRGRRVAENGHGSR